MTRILITLPNLHWIRPEVAFAAVKLAQDRRYALHLEAPSHKPYENNLHHIVNSLVEGGYDYWLNIDDDNPPLHNPLDLVEKDLDIVGFPTPIWHYTGEVHGERPIYWNAYDYVPEADAYKEHTDREGLQQVDAVGTGCVLFARRVFLHPALRYGAFFRTWHPDGTMNKGNDIAFCERARAAGFKVWCAFSHPCDQFAELSLNEVARALQGFRETPAKPSNGGGRHGG